MAVRALLSRLAKLEQARGPTSPFLLEYGSLDALEAECRAGIAEGIYDPTDMPVVIRAIRGWHEAGAWSR
jgi:hypothetical protein